MTLSSTPSMEREGHELDTSLILGYLMESLLNGLTRPDQDHHYLLTVNDQLVVHLTTIHLYLSYM